MRTGIVDRLSSVEVAPVDTPNGTRLSRVGVEVRNSLIYGLTGGGAAPATNYKLVVRLTAGQSQVIVDINTARPDIQNYGIDATYTLIDITTGKAVVNGTNLLARVLQHSRPAAALRRRPRLARRREPRRQGNCGQHPLAPGVVFRGGDVIEAVVPAKAGTR